MSIFSGDVFERIKNSYDDLRESEKRVADYILSFPSKIPNMTITELSHACGVSEATVNRFNKSIGYARFSDLKIGMTVGIITDKEKNISCDISTDDTIEVIASKLALSMENALHATENAINYNDVEKAVNLICEAKIINFVGIGGSKVAAETATNLFGRAGFMTVPATDVFSHYILVSKMTPKDLLVAVCLSGRTKDVLQLMQLAKSRGANVIILTSSDTVADIDVDVVLPTYSIAEPFYGNMLDGKFSQLYMIDLLYICSVLRNCERTKEYLEKTGNGIKIYTGK